MGLQKEQAIILYSQYTKWNFIAIIKPVSETFMWPHLWNNNE